MRVGAGDFTAAPSDRRRRAELATVISLLREMGMAHWMPEAEAEAKRLVGG